MLQSTGRPFRPQFTSPGLNLKDILDDRGIKVVEFAQRCGRPTKTISEIISGDTSITPETALQFERVLEKPTAETWMTWEASYRLKLAEDKENRKLKGLYKWAKEFPYKALAERGHITIKEDEASFVKELLQFFGVSGLEPWDNLPLGQDRTVAYRKAKSHSGNEKAVSAWLRIGVLKANKIKTPSFDEKRFKKVLPDIRSLTLLSREEFEPKLFELCQTAGVALVIEDELPGTCLSGAARWLTKDKALIQLSTRYAHEDQFWFSFFHEVGHILLHSKKSLFLDEDGGVDGDVEREADQFAVNCLLPPRLLDSFYDTYGQVGSRPGPHNEDNIREFADAVGVSPGIVFAQMRRRYKNLYKSPLGKKLIRKIRKTGG